MKQFPRRGEFGLRAPTRDRKDCPLRFHLHLKDQLMASYKVRLAVLGVAAAVLVAPVFSQKPIRMPRIELKEPNKSPVI
jgi:hypothetical protein